MTELKLFLNSTLSFLKRKKFPNFDDTIFLNTLESAYKSFVTSEGKVIKGVYPPLIDISYKISNSSYVSYAEYTPFALEGKERSIVQQQNFTNLSLHAIGQQLSTGESQVLKLNMKDYIPKVENGETSSLNLEKKSST